LFRFIWKAFWAVVFGFLLLAIVEALGSGGYFSWVYELQPARAWSLSPGEPFSREWHVHINLARLLRVILFVLVYCALYRGIPGKHLMKGIYFGIAVWLTGIVPELATNAVRMALATGFVVYWLIASLFKAVMLGLVTSSFMDEALEPHEESEQAVTDAED